MAPTKLKRRSQYMNWTELNWTDLKKSTQLHDVFTDHVTAYFALIGYRQCSETRSLSSPHVFGAIHSGDCKLQAIQFCSFKFICCEQGLTICLRTQYDLHRKHILVMLWSSNFLNFIVCLNFIIDNIRLIKSKNANNCALSRRPLTD